jgi:ABC-2 type transport system ATP-binding protein
MEILDQPQPPPAELPPEEVVIHTDRVEKKFGREFAVREVTFDVPKARIFGFIGPSGSGKTTTIRMLAGLYAPSGGEIEVFGQSPRRFSRATRQRIGYLPQHFVLYPNLSIWENLNFIASIYGLSLFDGRANKLGRLLELVELSEHKHKLARNISGGMQRRLSLAATLIHDPELVFLDEPTSGVDPVLRQKLWDHFRDLKNEGRTLFVTTQYVSEAAYCDLVGVISEGRLQVVDTPQGLRQRAFGGDLIDFIMAGPLDFECMTALSSLPYVRGQVTRVSESHVRLTVDRAKTSIPRLLNWCRENDLAVNSVEEFVPSFDEVFVELLNKERDHE